MNMNSKNRVVLQENAVKMQFFLDLYVFSDIIVWSANLICIFYMTYAGNILPHLR